MAEKTGEDCEGTGFVSVTLTALFEVVVLQGSLLVVELTTSVLGFLTSRYLALLSG